MLFSGYIPVEKEKLLIYVNNPIISFYILNFSLGPIILSTTPNACRGPSAVGCPGSQQCITETQLCDGQRDCPDGSDESQCAPQCKDAGTACQSHAHTHRAFFFFFFSMNVKWPVREGEEGSSEMVSACLAPGGFLCSDGTACIPRTQVCDGLSHCTDGSDEKSCSVAVSTAPGNENKFHKPLWNIN